MMDVAFVPASDLKRKYNVFGHFYSLEVPRIETLKCRSVLEITFKLKFFPQKAEFSQWKTPKLRFRLLSTF